MTTATSSADALAERHFGATAQDDAAHAAPFAHLVAGIGQVLPRVVEAYRTGGGVPYHAYGRDFRHGQGHINRPAFTHELPAEWLDAMPDVVARLRAGDASEITEHGPYDLILILEALHDMIDTGAVLRAACAALAAEAGFARTDVLAVGNDFFRLYRLHT